MRLQLLVVAILALPAVQPERGSATFDVPGYVAELDRVRAAIATASTPEGVSAMTTAVADRWWVTADGQVIVVDMRWIDEEVATSVANASGWPSVKEKIEQRLATMRAAASAAVLTGAQRPEQALESVLARPEFHRGAASRWLDEQRNRVSAWLLRMLNRFSGPQVSSRTVAVTFAWILSMVTFGALVFWLVRMLTRRSHAAALELGAAALPRAPAREWALRALAAARDGDIREAVRCGYHASLCKLEEQGTWSVDESRTPREYLSLLRTDDPRRSLLIELTRQFEQIWYGRRTATMDDAQRLTAHLEHLGCVRDSERAI